MLLGPSFAFADRPQGHYTTTSSLKKFFLKAAPDDLPEGCQQALSAEAVGFRFWLSAEKRALAVEATGLAYIHTRCIYDIFLSPDDLRALGARPILIDEQEGAAQPK